MDKRAALKATAVTAALLIISVLVALAIAGWLWSSVVVAVDFVGAVIFLGVFYYSCYNLFKD